jgi:AcrR family transcriptional regulator
LPRPAIDTRVADIVDAALLLLEQGGLPAVTTNALAAGARCSKDTLYSLFEDRDAILAALVARQAQLLNAMLDVAAAGSGSGVSEAATVAPREALIRAAAQLYCLLLSEASLVINRAAIADPSGKLSEILMESGQGRSAPRIKALLAEAAAEKGYPDAGVEQIYRRFFGLLISDQQILALHGNRPSDPPPEECLQAAERTVAELFA